jgi:uncharacterized protein (DUF1697 family)
MTRYVALLRGIAPTNPSMRNENLRRVAQGLGLTGVRTVISSGNVIFDSDSGDRGRLERRFEAAWPKELGFTSTSIVRSREEIGQLLDADPFAGYEHTPASYLLATFLQEPAADPRQDEPPGRGFDVVGTAEGVVLTVTDTTAAQAANTMTWLERVYGTRISSRTWKTVERIHAAMTKA